MKFAGFVPLRNSVLNHSWSRVAWSGFTSGASACGAAGVLLAVCWVVNIYVTGASLFDASLSGIWALAGVWGLGALVIGLLGTVAGALIGALAGGVNGLFAWLASRTREEAARTRLCDLTSGGMAIGVKLGLGLAGLALAALLLKGTPTFVAIGDCMALPAYLYLPPVPFITMLLGGLTGTARGIFPDGS